MRLAVISIAGAALWLYRGLLFPADPLARYPWSSDAWGHLLKAEFLATEMARGNFYPNIFPDWYNGIQMLRYYAPAPYYLLVPLFRLTGDVFAAGNWFLFGCALLGAEAFLLFHRRIGLWPAVAGGLLSLALPDHLRVAFAEGNLPRVLASAVLPVALWFLLNLLDTGRRRGVLGLAVSVGLIVLSHAMMAAIFVVALGLFILVYWQLSDLPSSRSVGAAFLGLGAGLALPGWWLLPSLTGGITEIDQTAASEAIAAFPLTVSLNPVLRLGDREAFYVGLSFVFVAIIAILTWRRLTALTRSLLIVGLATALLSSTVLNPLYDALPMHHLFWPIRFLSFGGVALLLGSMSMVSDCSPGGHPQAPALAGPGSMSSERACSPGGHPQAPARDGSN
ncbi:MAG: hypothetical protein HYY04_10445, partial [Chloroflexi bacterium]|nr:hypothetical protein [Chloroflexota bacterium]